MRMLYDGMPLHCLLPLLCIITRIQPAVSITPSWGGFSSSIARHPKRVPIPNDSSSECAGRDVFNADLFGTDTTISTVEMSALEVGPGVV